MIQRIQTLLLIVVVLLSVAFSYLPIFEFVGYESTYIMNAYKTFLNVNENEVISKNMGVGVLQGLVMLVSIIVIFLFKKRQLQMKLLKLNLLLITLEIVAIVVYTDLAKEAIGSDPNDILMGLRIGAIIPVLCFILVYASIYFIKKDEALVRAADRLR
jgi:glucan phosphoethanolaminetransferase (alkaline phosphatase superfamily)